MEVTIKQAVELTGLSADTLRYYEKEGFIKPRRQDNGYRYYSEKDIAILKNLVVLRYAHFSLAEIKGMEEFYTLDPNAECNEISRRVLTDKRDELKQAIVNYQRIIDMMDEVLAMVENCESYSMNEELIDEFIFSIFDDIRNEKTKEVD